MKLAKKALAVVVAIALISTLAISAFAASATLSVTTDADDVVIGDEFTVTLAVNGAKGLTNAGLTLTYNTEMVEYVSNTRVDTTASMLTGGVATPGSFNVGLAYDESNTADSITLYTVTFKALAAGDAEFNFALLDGDIDGLDDATAGSTTVTILTEAPTDAPTEPTTAPATEPTAAPTDDTTKAEDEIPQTGDAGIAVAAGLVVLAGAAFVASKKRK